MPQKTVKFIACVSAQIEVRDGVKTTQDLSEEEMEKAWSKLHDNAFYAEWSMEEGELEDGFEYPELTPPS